MPNTREKLIDLCKQANDELRLRAGCSTWGDFADHLIANGVTFATDNNVGDKRTPTDDEMSANTEIFDVYIPCRTCGKLIPAGGDNHCLTCRVWQLRLEETMPKWISVKDRLPEKYGKYLCRYAFGESEEDPDFKVIWFYSHLGKIVFQGEGCLGMRVTHWMPLPQPPKGE